MDKRKIMHQNYILSQLLIVPSKLKCEEQLRDQIQTE